MFKTIQMFRIDPSWNQAFEEVNAALVPTRFVECGPSQESACGWTEPRGEANGPLVEVVGGHLICKIMFESKVLPGAVIKEKVDKRAKEIEAATGRMPGKKERKELSEEIRHDLLTKAFTKKICGICVD